MTIADTASPTRIPPAIASRRLWALRHDIPLRWRGGWADRSAKWGSTECDLFHALPSPAMRAWIEQEERREPMCPRPANAAPDSLTVKECIARGECGCDEATEKVDERYCRFADKKANGKAAVLQLRRIER